MSAINLYRQLSEEWEYTAGTRPARAALARWADECPELAGFRSPRELVERCHDRRIGTEAHRILAAVLSQAADPWAARTFLQAILPGLAGISHSQRDFIDGRRTRLREFVWDSGMDLDQQVVTTAFEVIHEIAGQWHPWPAHKVFEVTKRRVRTHVGGELRRRERRAPDSELERENHEVVARPPTTPADELVRALVDAVERGLLTRIDAGMVYGCRVWGLLVEDLAPLVGYPDRRGYRRRARAEQILVEEAFGCGRRRATELLAAAAS